MKIAMIGQKGIPSRAGGIEVHVEEISQRLVQLVCNIEVYCRKGFCEREYKACYKGIRLVYTPFIRFKYLDTITHSFISTIKALLSNCDVFHYHALGPATLSFIPRLFRKKVVCTVHGLDWQRGKWRILASAYLRFGEIATARFPNKTINVSENLVEYYKRKHLCNTVYIPNGAEPVEYAPPDIITEKYGLRKEEYILFLARLVPEKGAHYLIDAYNKLQTTKKLVIAGCSCNTDVYVKSLHDKARDNTNILFTGFVSGQTLQELYSNAFLYVLPSDVEGLPISLLEAMSYGNCCLTSDIPENTAVIGELGLSFKNADVNDCYQKLNRLIKDEELVRNIKNRAAEYVLAKYNWDEIARETYNLYKELLIETKQLAQLP